MTEDNKTQWNGNITCVLRHALCNVESKKEINFFESRLTKRKSYKMNRGDRPNK